MRPLLRGRSGCSESDSLNPEAVGGFIQMHEAELAINSLISMPADRVRSRVVSGIHVPALHKLSAIAGQYAQPSP